MYRTRTFLALAATITFAVASLTGCGVAEKVTEQAVETAQDVEIEQDGDSVTITTEDSESGDTETTIRSGEEAEIPDSFPEGFPLYDGTVTDSASMTAEDRQIVSVTIETDDDVQAVKGFYAQALPDADWEIVVQSDQGTSNVDYLAQSGSQQAEVSISGDNGTTEISITIGSES
jgi:hypothetical protein